MKTYITKDGREVVIRPAVKADASKMVDYLQAIGSESDFLTFGPGELNIPVEREEIIIADCSHADNKLFLVAVLNGTVVGNLNFNVNGGTRARTRHAGEFGVSVRKEYWGCGIGRELLQYLIDWAKETGVIRKINLRVREDNLRGIQLYKKLGFTEEGRISREFSVDGKFYSSIWMGMEID